MKKSFPLLVRFLIFVVVPVSCVVAWIFLHFRAGLPPSSGEATVPGIALPVSIVRDAQGVPSIQAKTDRDVFFAMGYVHAQDRLWQLEVQRRVAQGRVSEIFGKDAIGQDAWMRTLGIYEAAKSAWPALSQEAKDSLSAYAEGVNAWIKHSRLPIEFEINGVRPELWTVYDSLAWSKLFALNLAGNMKGEIARYLAVQLLPKDKMASIFGVSAGANNSSASAGVHSALTMQALWENQDDIERNLKIGGRHVGSNAWVVSGKLTQTGHAMLANDPHMGLQIPSLWYPVAQQGDRISSAGMSLVGLPLVIFGTNRDIAWGGTSMTADVQDLYFEQIDPGNPDRYKVNDRWENFQTRTEPIIVKREFPEVLGRPLEPVKVKVRMTRHGPIVSDLAGVLNQPVSLRWVALEPGDTTYDAFFRLNYARDWVSFKQALRGHVAPALNMLYADRRGNIGYLGIGKVPVRSKGDGAMPVDGATDEYKWKDFIPFDRMPQSYNPEKGYIVSANNRLVGADYPYFISNEWAPPGRAQRIDQLIQEHVRNGRKLTVDMFSAMQADVLSLPAQKIATVIQGMHPQHSRQEEALRYFRGWQGDMHSTMRPAAQAAAIFNVWMKHLRAELFMPDLKAGWDQSRKKDVLDSIVYGVELDALSAALSDGRNIWCDQTGKNRDANNNAPKSCARALSRSLDLALRELEKLGGSNMASWQWGEIHHAVYEHAPFSHSKLFSLMFEKKIANGGSADTINVANAAYRESEGYRQTFGAGFRQIVQFGEGNNTAQLLYMNSTGQSGNVFSKHYADMVTPFRDVQYVGLQQADAGPHNTFVLVPGRK